MVVDYYDLQERAWCLQRGGTAPGRENDTVLDILHDLLERLQYPPEEPPCPTPPA